MVTDIDNGKGIVRTYWRKIRERVLKVDAVFAEIIDALDPDDTFPLYLAYYPYGEFIGDTEQPLFPKQDGGVFGLNDAIAPKELIEQLGYGSNSLPMVMLLEKELEYFVHLEEQSLTIPAAIYKPGAILPLARLLRNKNSRFYAPNGILVATSGVRSCFLLPHAGSAEPHASLQRNLNIKSSAPKILYEHWQIFKEIANSSTIENPWRSCVLYFSKKWVDMLYQDKAWLPLQLHLYRLGWHQFEYNMHHIDYELIFSVLQKKRNLKPNPYLTDTAKHLFNIALGNAPGYGPAWNNESLPIDIIQQAYHENYKLDYHPIIIQPFQYQFEKDKWPVYYSLQYPSTYSFSPKSQKGASTISELRDLEHIVSIFTEELAINKMCKGTIFSEIASVIKYNYFHSKPDRHKVIQSTTEIMSSDARFCTNYSSDAPFLRGCISIIAKS